MIEYEFTKLIKQVDYIHPDFKNVFEDFIKRNVSKSDKISIGDVWNRLVECCEIFPLKLHDAIACMKNDVLMSLYTSATYGAQETIGKSKIALAYINNEPKDMRNGDHSRDIRKGISVCQKNLQKSITPMHLSGQLFDQNALEYFQPYWNPQVSDIKVFNELDYYFYIKEYKHWPFHTDNLDGMRLQELFKSLNSIFKDIYTRTEKHFTLSEAHSVYIFEQLFQPAHLAQYITGYLNCFEDLFYKYKNQERERSLLLSLPLFKLPLPVIDSMKDSYLKALREYIKFPNDSYNESLFIQHMNLALLYKYCLFPLLQTILANVLFISAGGDYNKIKQLLTEYLENEQPHDYSPSIMKINLDTISQANYPSRPLKKNESDKTQVKNEDTISENKTVSILNDNVTTRNNTSVETFEINLTYNFYCRRKISNIFEYRREHRNFTIDIDYLNDIKNLGYFNSYYNIKNGNNTDNYLHYKNKNIGFFIQTE